MTLDVGIAAAAFAAVSALIFLTLTALKFRRQIRRLRNELMVADSAGGPMPELPDMVRNYAIKAGGRQGGPRVIHGRHAASLTMQPNGRKIPLVAEQWTSSVESEFVWHARGRMGLLPVSVLDAYVGGKGTLVAQLLGGIPVANGSGPDFDKGEMMRYLSELPVYPDAIMNNASLLWRQLGDDVVEVTGTSPTGPASVRFYFDTSGDIIRMEADDRPMTVGSGTVPTAWHGTYSDYLEMGTYRIPTYGEVGWVLPTRFFTYWRGRVTGYERAD